MAHKIALLIHSLAGGGAEKLMSRLATRWNENHEIHLVTWSKIQPDDYEVPNSVRRYALNLQQPSSNPAAGLMANIKRVGSLRKTLRQIAPDVALSFSDQMNIVALEAARPLPFPTWIAEHSNPEQQVLSRFWELWRRRSYPTCTGCVVLTNEIRDYMQRWVEGARLHVIPPAINIPSTPDAPRAASPSLRYLFVGRLSQEKGVDRLLTAWKTVKQELSEATLEIVGDGPSRKELEALSRSLALEGVKFLGWQQDLSQIYDCADIFVLPSRYEGFPVALLEALSCGLAGVVTNSSSALKELQAVSRCLEVVPQAGPEESIVHDLASRMLKFGEDSSLRESFVSGAADIARRYSWDAVGPMWDRLVLGTDS